MQEEDRQELTLKKPLLSRSRSTHAPSSLYGSTSSSNWTRKMEENGEPEVELTTSCQPATTSEPNNRRITVSSVYIPRRKVKWYYYLIQFLQFKFRRRASPHSNQIHTTKYTILTFVPKNLIEQFHRFANLYFLLVLILNFIPAIEAFGKEVAWIPLAFVLLVTAIKDVFEDYRRYRSDKELNSLPSFVYSFEESQFVQKCWKDVRVGDFVRLMCDELIPADILLLHSADEDGLCYIQTSNLDGETNLKQRHVVRGALEQQKQSIFDGTNEHDHTTTFKPLHFTGELFCEPPHNQVYDFKGYIQRQDGTRIPVDRSHLLLRGCVLRNTDYIIGIVAYAGHETKAMLNNSGPRAKRSKLERDINAEIVSQVIILFALCFLGAVASGIWTGKRINRNIIYFPFSSESANPALEGFIRFWTFVIILQVIIPVSLYVSLEIVKLAQTFFINWDLEMYYEPQDRPFQCRALNITEDLGQIKYVFSDKTGTLTENEMIFKCCTIGGKNYPHSLEVELSSVVDPQKGLNAETEEPDYPNPPVRSLEVDHNLLKDINVPASEETLFVHDFLVNMAICNTVVVSHQTHSNSTSSEKNGNGDVEIVYEAESPDEFALVEAACCYGYSLLSRSPTLIRLKTPRDVVLEYDVLHVLEFSSERKRMSVIVRERSEGKIILYCKGADSVIYNRLVHTELEGPATRNISIQIETQEHLDQYAMLGLRTLCLAKRVLTEREYQDWLVGYQQADTDLVNREQIMLDCASEIETQLELLGATGIEDRLQDGVADTIDALRSAGMKVWVLTGDKKETAINVGYASLLLNQDMEVFNLKAKSEDECLEMLQAHFQEMFPTLSRSFESSSSSVLSRTFDKIRAPLIKLYSLSSPHSRNGSTKSLKEKTLKALVVDGETLSFALKPPCRQIFSAIAKECYSVICCRVAPLQKAAVVQLVKESESALTLAVGDGANDVSMIQMANVGVGIAGREGTQAVLASDFNMARFRYLKKLLLVHGHWCYARLANMMLYFFYKNVMYAVLLFWYQLFNGFSGSNPIDGINLQIFNLIYTSIPIMIVAVLDQDLRSDKLLHSYEYYEQGLNSRLYTRTKFWIAMLEAFYQSAVIFFVAYGAYYESTIGIVEFGFVINISVVIVANLYLAVETLHWTVFNHVILWGSILIVFVFNFVYCALDTQQRIMDTYFVLQMLAADARFWFVLLVTPMIALFPRLICKSIVQDVFPTPVHKARANEKKGKRKLQVNTDPVSSPPHNDMTLSI